MPVTNRIKKGVVALGTGVLCRLNWWAMQVSNLRYLPCESESVDNQILPGLVLSYSSNDLSVRKILPP